MNRIRDFLDPIDEDAYGDFVVVSGSFGSACVTHVVAADVERQLDACPPQRWITFLDRVGSRIRVRRRDIRAIAESTAAQRAEDRRLDRARRLEEKADRRAWEDD